MTAHKVEKLTQLRRDEERRVGELLRFSTESQRLGALAKSELQLSNIREEKLFLRNMNETEKCLIEKQQEDKKLQDKYIKDQTELFQEEQSRSRLQQEKETLDIERICESSEELKELERNIKIAYVNKARAEQYCESQCLQESEEAREHAIEEKMEFDRIAAAKRELEKEENRREILKEQKWQLQQQMAENEVTLSLESTLIYLTEPPSTSFFCSSSSSKKQRLMR